MIGAKNNSVRAREAVGRPSRTSGVALVGGKLVELGRPCSVCRYPLVSRDETCARCELGDAWKVELL